MSAIEDLLEFICRSLQDRDLDFSEEHAALAILMELNVPTKPIGFGYLHTAILLYCEDPTQSITKSLYPAIAKQYGYFINAAQIECSIRKVIHSAWNQGDPILWRQFFPNASSTKSYRPTNLEFISSIARIIQLCQAACHATRDND